MYQRLVGEGGLTAQYFFQSLTLAEAEDYIKGQDRRHRQGWEQARMISSYMVGAMTGEVPEIPLPWDDEKSSAEKKAEEEAERQRWENLKAYCKRINEQKNNEQDKGQKPAGIPEG